MKNMPTIFVWDNASRSVINKPAKGCEWVFQGKGVATRKWDGVAILVENGKVYRRFEWRPGEDLPNGFIKLQEPNLKKPNAAIPGWVPIDDRFKTKPQGPEERALKEAWQAKLKQLTDAKMKIANKILPSVVSRYAPEPLLHPVMEVPNGTYELVGPKIRGNHERLKGHALYSHGEDVVRNVPRTFDKLKAFLETFDGEGIVWHMQAPGQLVQMAKIKRRDFGFFTRITKEDLAMAYGVKTAPFEGKITAGPVEVVDLSSFVTGVEVVEEAKEAGFASVFEPDNSDTGDDIHLGV